MHARSFLVSLVSCVALVAFAAPAHAWQAEAEALAYSIADGGFSLAAPEGWKRVQPKSSIVETEFSIPSEGEGVQPGRMTVMGAGGSVQANVDRWFGQFAQADGSDTKDKATTKKLKLAGCEVTIVDITGTYKDAPAGPFAGGKALRHERVDPRFHCLFAPPAHRKDLACPADSRILPVQRQGHRTIGSQTRRRL